MIELPEAEGQDRGRALYQQYPNAVTNLVKERITKWFESRQYRGLKNNCRSMDRYIDNSAPGVSSFVSDITPQTIRRGYNEFSALFAKFLETDPLFSIRRGSKISKDQESRVIEEIENNLEKTYYRDRCLIWTIDDIVRYGTAATYNFACNDYNANSLMTVKSDEGNEGTYDQVYGQGETAVISTPVHPLNVIMDPRASFMTAPDYQGFLADISIANLSVLMDNPAYIAENMKEVIEACKLGEMDEYWYDGPNSEKRNYSKGHANIKYLWTRLPIEGNEDDTKWYAVEMIKDKIIRIDENPLDDNTIPLAIKRVLPRKYEWYGNSVLQDKICIYNLQYWLINTTVESTARLMDRIVFFDEGKIDVTAINQRHTTGGLVGVKNSGVPLDKLVFSPALPNVAYRENDWPMQLTRREDQDSSAMPNFNPQSEGGPTNKTLGGAQMMASIGEMKMAHLMNNFAVGLKDVAKHQLVLLRNIATGSKAHLVGDIQFSVKVSNVFNYVREGLDSMNRLTQAINFKATKLPEFNFLNLGTMVKEWTRNSIKRENIDEYIDLPGLDAYEKQQQLNNQMLQQPAQPSATMGPGAVPPGGAALAAPIPAPIGNQAAPVAMPGAPMSDSIGGAR